VWVISMALLDMFYYIDLERYKELCSLLYILHDEVQICPVGNDQMASGG
jgi:hypothetical protein